MRDARKNMVNLRYEWDAAVLRRAELVLRLKDSVDRIRAAHHAVLDAEMRKIEATSDVQGLKDRNSHIMERLQAEKEAMQQATDEATRTREAGRVLSQAVQDILAEEPEKRDLLSSLCEGKNPEEMQLEIGGEEAKLELIHAANPNVVREFERRAGEIARLTRKMEGSSEKLETLTREIDGLMAKWEPTLDELVAKISDAFAYNFEQISCAGEIRVHKAEDFDAWALDVMVRFRYVFLTIPQEYITNDRNQRERDTPATYRPPPIWRRARRLHHLLPHGSTIHGPVTLPRRRRDQPGHGPPQRAHGARAHGRDRLPRAHQPVLPHHPQAPHRAPIRPQDAHPMHCQRRTHAPRGPQARLQAVP